MRSFGARGGPPGGRMLRTFKRAVRAGVTRAAQDPYSHSSASSTSSSRDYKPFSLSTTAPSYWPFLSAATATRSSDDFDWVSVDENGDDYDEIEAAFTNSDDGDDNESVFGSVPSRDEVLNAVSALQLVIDPTHYSQFLEDNCAYNLENIEAYEDESPARLVSRVSSFGSESDWIEPSLHLCYPGILERHGSIKVYDALHLLQTEPSIKRMVVSLSSDKAVWDAVLNNEMVRELRDSLTEVGNKVLEDQDDNNDNSEGVANILSSVYEQIKVKVIEIIGRITELVKEMFQLPEDEKAEGSTTSRTGEMLQVSLMLLIMVLIIVVIDRAHWA